MATQPGPNKERIRAKFLLDYRNAAMLAIEKEQAVVAQEAVAKLCIKNQNLLQCKTPTFIFQDKWYAPYALPSPTEMKGWNRILHPDLLEEVRDLLTKVDFAQRVELAEIDNFFASVLTEATHVDDLNRLIPAGFASSLPTVKPEEFNLAPKGLPDMTINLIKEQNAKGLQYLSEIAIKNLLLARI